MKVTFLDEKYIDDFAAYCKRHRPEVDESDLYDADLESFIPNEDNPTYVLLDDEERIRAVASLIFNDYLRSGKRARFRIFHSEIHDVEIYRQLLQAMLKHTVGLEKIYLFVHVDNIELMESFHNLGFFIDRYSFFMVREEMDAEACKYKVPEGYSLLPFVPGRDEQKWCEVRNPAFSTLKGSETPVTLEQVEKLSQDEEYLDGGMMILYDGTNPAAVVRGSKDVLDGEAVMDIGPVAVLPKYQGRGLGRILIRAACSFAVSQGYQKAVLCVNADNERAKKLYIEEGFRQKEAVACYMLEVDERGTNIN